MSAFLVPAIYVVAALPALIDNIRADLISNRSNMILFLVGIALMFGGPQLGIAHQAPGLLHVFLGIVVLIIIFVFMPRGGVIKFWAATLPWLQTEPYILAFIAASFALTLIAVVTKKDARAVPPSMICTLAALIWVGMSGAV